MEVIWWYKTKTIAAMAVAWAKEKFEHCRAVHDNCKQLSTLGRPKRLLDIHTTQNVRLVEETDHNMEYACLSYRWGEGAVKL